MRIAILIGIKEYANISDLPGCINDVNAINDVLSTSNEFDEIKIYKDRVDSDLLKSELSNLFAEWKDKQIEELFFYFSGHGSFFQNEFYYLLSNYDENQRRLTSLQNSEIDKMIKSLKPKMVTKVIDACQSGVAYVKGNNVVEKYYTKTAENFEKCYFLHSSMTSQYSYQNDDLSEFTKSFLKSLNANNKSSIRYKHIIDYISDEFERTTEQTPFFVAQADFTETFLNSSEQMKIVLAKYLKCQIEPQNLEEQKEEVKSVSYVEKIKKEAENYSTHEEVNKLLSSIGEIIKKYTLKTNLKDIYEIQSALENNLNYLVKSISIGRWLVDNKHNFFAEAKYEINEYKEEETTVNPFGSFMSMRARPNKIVTKTHKELIGFENTVELPFSYLIVNYIPKFPNIPQYAFLITFLVSKKDIKFFYGFTDYNEEDWNRKKINPNFKWSSIDFIIKKDKEILEFIKNTTSGIEINIKDISEKKFDIEK
ncbi:MAG: caspase family protein [Gelidibacter sp.]